MEKVQKNLKFFITIEKLKKAREKERVSEKEVMKVLIDSYNQRINFNSLSILINYLKSKFPDKILPKKEIIRRIAIRAGYKVKYVCKKVEKPLEKCPICGLPLFEKFSYNLKGEKVVDYYYCKFCGYKSRDRKDLPIKFKFIL
ncbi:MAG: hypothetical protein QW197_01005 [Candidatus Aenigmatarchaeota archaeon]